MEQPPSPRPQLQDVVPAEPRPPRRRIAATAQKHHWYKRKPLWVGSIVIVIAAAGLAFWYFAPHAPSLPANVKDQIRFSAFLPAELPPGYAIQENSYAYQNGVLTYRISAPNKVTVLATEQPQPTNFDINTFYKGLKNSRSAATPYGTAQAGQFLKSEVGTLTASGTWLLLSAPENTDSSVLLTILSHMKQTK